MASELNYYVPPRPFPTEPDGDPRPLRKAEASVYDILPHGGKKLVPSEIYIIGGGGGGFGANPEPEWVEFYLHVPLDSEQLDAEVRRYIAKLIESMTPQQRAQFTEDAQREG